MTTSSLPEIAARFNMTEQAVRNALKGAEQNLSRSLATLTSLEGV